MVAVADGDTLLEVAREEPFSDPVLDAEPRREVEQTVGVQGVAGSDLLEVEPSAVLRRGGDHLTDHARARVTSVPYLAAKRAA